jgi:hypothetical protein
MNQDDYDVASLAAMTNGRINQIKKVKLLLKVRVIQPIATVITNSIRPCAKL